MRRDKLDEQYLSERKVFSAKYGTRELWSVIDHWPLYCGVRNLARFLANTEILKSTLSVPGHIAEFGSWRGANLLLFAKLLKIFDPHGAKKVFCFDSFEGLTQFAPQDGGAMATQGMYRGSLDELKDIIALYGFEGDIAINVGIIEQTLPPLVERQPELSFSLVYVDTDLYESTHVILECLHPRLMPGGVFVFDEWNSPTWPGEGIAANEFLQKHAGLYHCESVPSANQPSLILRKKRP